MYAVLTVSRYPSKFIYFAICAMAFFRIPLSGKKDIIFSKLMGCGKNGTFDIHPDWNQWAVMIFTKKKPDISALQANPVNGLSEIYGTFISNWWKRFNCETWTIVLELSEGHGSWNGIKLKPETNTKNIQEGPVAVLTRATIRLQKLPDFWKNVAPVARQMEHADGLIASIGIGEMPFIRQATFSIWKSMDDMKRFAYTMHEHRDVIKKTRKEKWYSEDMFLRFSPLFTQGSIRGINIFPTD
jgi:hypothetical protein